MEQYPLFLVSVAEAAQQLSAALGIAAGASAAGPTPLYPRLLAVVGAEAEVARIAQVVCSALSCALVWLVARPVFAPGVAFAAGLAAAVYGPMIYFSGELLPATAALTLGLGGLWVLLWADGGAGRWRFLPAGVVLGLAALCGPQGLGAIVLGAGWIGRRDGAAALVFAMGALVACATLWMDWRPTVGWDWGNPRLFWQGIEWMPGVDSYLAREESELIAVLMWEQGLAFPFGLVAPLALVGLGYRLAVGGRARAENALLLYAGGAMIGALVYGATAATRLPAAVALLPYACAGAIELMRRRRQWRQVVPGAAALLVLCVVFNAGSIEKRGEQRYWLGYAYDELGMRANALREYGAAIDAGVDLAAPYYALAALHGAKAERGRAIDVYRKLLARWPQENRAREQLAAQQLRADQPAAAAANYETLLAGGGDAASLLGRLGDARSLSGDWPGAARAYGDLLALRPDSSRARYQLARVYEAQGQAREALSAYGVLLDDARWGRSAALGLADLLIEMDRRSGILGAAREVGWWRSEGLVTEESLQTAEGLFAAALAQKSDSVADLWGLAKLLFWQGLYDEALVYVVQLGELAPGDYRVHFFLGKLYALLGGEGKALEAFERFSLEKRRAEIDERVKVERDALLKQLPGGRP